MNQRTDEAPRALTEREQYIQDVKDFQQRCLEGARLIQECAQQMLVNMGMSEEKAIALRRKIERTRRRKKTRQE